MYHSITGMILVRVHCMPLPSLSLSLFAKMAAFNLYTADIAQQGEPDVRITEKGLRNGPRMFFQATDGWIEAPGATARQFADAGPNDPGLFTLGQWICIGVTLIDWSGANWDTARMVHISDYRSSMIQNNGEGFYKNDTTDYTAVDGDNLYVVITSKSLRQLEGVTAAVKANLPQLQDDHIWCYLAETGTINIGSAVSNNGYFGEPPM